MRKLSILCFWTILFSAKNAYAIGFTAAAAIGGSLAAAGGGLTAAGIAVGTGITAATVFGGAKLLKSATKSPDLPSIPQAKAPDQGAAEAAAKEKVDRTRRAISRNRTVYTNPLGLTPSEKSDISLKTLTGA